MYRKTENLSAFPEKSPNPERILKSCPKSNGHSFITALTCDKLLPLAFREGQRCAKMSSIQGEMGGGYL